MDEASVSVDKSGLSFEHRRPLVSAQRFTERFKGEAVKVVDRGYGVPEVAARLGISAHSLYNWVKAMSPDKSEQQSKELLETKGDILRLRAQMRRVEEERDLQKKPCGTFEGPRVKYRFMIEHRRDYAITLMFRMLRGIWLRRDGEASGILYRNSIT